MGDSVSTEAVVAHSDGALQGVLGEGNHHLASRDTAVGRHGAQRVGEARRVRYSPEEPLGHATEFASGLGEVTHVPEDWRTKPSTSQTNLGMGFQWRPNYEDTSTRSDRPRYGQGDINLGMLEALQSVTHRLGKIAAPRHDGPELLFTGAPWEDPRAFLDSFEGWLLDNRVPLHRYHALFRRCLKEQALKWHNTIQHQDWPLVRDLFLRTYDSVSVRAKLWVDCLGTRQRPDQSTTAFVIEKWNLTKRLIPELWEPERLAIIQRLMLPETRMEEGHSSRPYNNCSRPLRT